MRIFLRHAFSLRCGIHQPYLPPVQAYPIERRDGTIAFNYFLWCVAVTIEYITEGIMFVEKKESATKPTTNRLEKTSPPNVASKTQIKDN